MTERSHNYPSYSDTDTHLTDYHGRRGGGLHNDTRVRHAHMLTAGELDLSERDELRALSRGSQAHTTEQSDGYDV